MRRHLRKIGIGFFALMLLVMVVIAGALLYLKSDAGSRLLRAQILQAVNDQLQGRVELGRVRLYGESVVLEDLKLFTPEGELVADAKRVEVTGDIAGLLRGAIALTDAKVDTLR